MVLLVNRYIHRLFYDDLGSGMPSRNRLDRLRRRVMYFSSRVFPCLYRVVVAPHLFTGASELFSPSLLLLYFFFFSLSLPLFRILTVSLFLLGSEPSAAIFSATAAKDGGTAGHFKCPPGYPPSPPLSPTTQMPKTLYASIVELEAPRHATLHSRPVPPSVMPEEVSQVWVREWPATG